MCELGHCYPCMRKLASCDQCIIKPELCHYDKGTCREPEWGESYCLKPHTVYLSNTGTGKVGITRGGNEPIRWVDQGATQGLEIRNVADRLASGMVETALKPHISDRTNWRKMLSGTPAELDLAALRDQIFAMAQEVSPNSVLAGSTDSNAEIIHIRYPVERYPEKVKSLNIEMLGEIEGQLWGIKGQYLIFDCGVINIRKYQGYKWAIYAA